MRSDFPNRYFIFQFLMYDYLKRTGYVSLEGGVSLNRKAWLLLVVIILAMVLAYNLSASANAKNLQTNLEDQAQKEFDELYYSNTAELQSFSLEKIKKIDEAESWIALLESSDGTMMYAHYELDWLKQLHVKAIGSFPGFTYMDIPTDDGIYGVLVGTDDSLEVAKVDLRTQGAAQLDFSFSTEEEKYIIEYEKLPDAISSSAPATFTFYNKDNQVIEK